MKISVTSDDRKAALRELCSRKLVQFIRRGAWDVVEPDHPYIHGWHMDALGEHLEAAATFDIKKLAIAIPPGTAKSLTVSVFFSAWLWTKFPGRRIIGTSYAERLTSRDNARALALIQSDWYQALWGEDFALTRTSTLKYENDKRGFREAMPFTSLTGSRGDHILIDDPLSVDDAESPTVREKVGRTFLEAVPTRVNSHDKSSIIVIQQRLHADDVIGLAISRELGYTVLELPMEFDTNRRCHTVLGWSDPRTNHGELLFPQKFPSQVIQDLRKNMGSYAWAGQMQQNPSPRGGGLFKEEWFADRLQERPDPRRIVKSVRWWDIAGTEEQILTDPDWTVGVLMDKLRDGSFVISHVERQRVSPAGLENLMLKTAKIDGKNVLLRWGKDPGAAGKIASLYLTRALVGWNVRGVAETGKKVKRAEPLAAQAEGGNVKMVQGRWNAVFLDELCTFPTGSKDDQVDAASGSFSELIKRSSRTVVVGRQSATTGVRPGA